MVCTCRGWKIKHLYLNYTIWPKLYDAPEPTLINWENIDVGSFNRALRKIVLNLVSLIVLLAGFCIIAYGQKYLIVNKNTGINCSKFGDIQTEDALFDYYERGSQDKV